MKVIGILGGMSNQATGEYYRRLNSAVNARLGGWNTAEAIISSVNFGVIERCVRNAQWDEAGDYLAAKARGLERAGAELLLCVSNTMHRVCDRFTDEIHVPFLHIVDPTAEAIGAAGLSAVALIGTKPVMADDYLRRRYTEKFGIEILTPDAAKQDLIDRIIFDELVRGVVSDASKAVYRETIAELTANGAQGVILGCTEFGMAISPRDFPGVPLFDTAGLHVGRAVEIALE